MTDLFEQNNTMQYFQDRGNEERQNQINVINNLVSPDFIESEQKKGEITAFETLKNAKKWGYAIPYIGTSAETVENLKILNLQNKVREGVQLSSEEMETYKEFVLDIASQSARGQTIPSMAFDGFLQSVPYMGEFGVGLATSKEGIGLASLGQTGGKLAVKKALKDLGVKTIKDTTKQQVKKQIALNTSKNLLKDSTIGVAKFNMKYLPQQGVKRFSEVELDENLMVTPEGQVLINEAENNPATSVLKAMALMQIESFSETAGFAFNYGERAIGKYISPILLKHLPSKFITNLNKLSKQVTGLSTVKALQKFGWNGLLEEYGEERVSDFLQTTFDLDGQKGYSFEQFLQAIFPPKEQAIAELLSFAIMGGTGTGIKKGVDYSRYRSIAKDIQEKSKSKDGSYDIEKMKRLIKRNNPTISDENLNKAVKSVNEGILKTKDYSVDDFLLDCGVFRMYARKSNTDERLTKILQEGGVKEEEIENFLDYASLDDKAQLLKIHEEANIPKQDYSALKSDLLKAGHSEEQADLEVQSLNRIDKILMDKYNAEGEAENLIKKRNLKIQALQNEVQQQKEKEYVQNSELKQKEIYHFKPSELKTNAKLFQYKENSDEEGKTDRMNGVEEWSAQDSGIVIVWESKEGQKYIADGHQRLGLAKRLNDENIRLDGVLYRETDGYTPEDVRMIAAKKNIAEGSGTPIDTAKILRELGGADNYPASLPRRGAMYEYGIALSRLGDEAFEKVINGYVTPAQGALIANIIRTDHAKQSLAVDVIAQEGIETLSETELMARQVLSTPTETVEQTNLFGTQNILQSSAVEKIKIIDGAIKQLKKSKNLMAHLGNNSRAIEKNGNKLNKKNNEELKKSAEIAIEVVKKQAFYEGIISNKANELAQKEKNGEISHNEAIKQFVDFVMRDDIIDVIFNGEKISEEKNTESIEQPSEEHTEDINNGQGSLFNMPTPQEELNNELPKFKPEKKPESIDKYEDYGEKIEGAKKDLWVSYRSSLERPLTDDFEKISLSKDFPEPNYEGLIREGIDVNILATIKALRDIIPTKPRGRYGTYKRKEYIQVLKFVRELASDLISGKKKLTDIDEALSSTKDIKEQVQLYIELGYPAFKNANGWKIRSGVFSIANGEKLDKPTTMYYAYNMSNKARKSSKAFKTKEELIDYLREEFNKEPEKEERKTKLDIYQVYRTGEIIIGKKVGTNKYIDLKGGFTSAKEARAYYKENEKELLEKLQKLKETPETRGSANKERVGEDYREGMNITPEKFANEFGFRGVQFGNYVEQSKRIEDMNEAYDALLDLANLIDVPSRAISLNGSLGIAFGARGSGGKSAAKAHYEPDEVVINLTKKKGAGSLAHEWWHALDNFFGKLEGSEIGYISERYASKTVRQEVFEAYKGIVNVLKKTMFDRSQKIDLTRTKDYWSTTREMTARGFEAYIIAKAKMKGFRNDYLANILTEQEYRDIELYPYPYESEMKEVIEAYDKLFSVLKTKETEKGITFYQSAYHGTPHNFDEFSTDNIGSGEGAQAHGWGLYFAENKDVSETYRQNLSPQKLYYKNKEISSKDFLMWDIYKNGKQKRLKFTENLLNDFKSRKDVVNEHIKNKDTGEFINGEWQYNNYEKELEILNQEIDDTLKLFKKIQNVDVSKFKLETVGGQLYEVDIPEADVLLDENKYYSEQSEFVKNALKKMYEDNWEKYPSETKLAQIIYTNNTKEEYADNLAYKEGRTIYQALSKMVGSDRKASELLNEYGIKGITYDGNQDGRCYVIFDDKAIKVLNKYYQEKEQQQRAKIEFGNNETIITLAEGHDSSSFMHELAHMYLHDIQELAKTNKRAEKDLQEIYNVLEFDEKNATPEEFIDMHERFARSFEAYLLNGEAPTARLKSVFERFKEFLKDVYETLSDLNVNFSKEVQECFDRLFTTDEEYEKEVLPLYKQNQELADSINQQETLSYKIKNNLNAVTEAWKSFYDTVIIPIDTRLGKISPELKKLLRKHTFDMTYQAKLDCDKITPFLLKIKEIKKNKSTIEYNGTQFNAYNLLSYALNNRDSYMVNKIVKSLEIKEEFEQVRALLDQLHEETESVGLSVGYLESYYPRMVKTDKTDEFIDLFEKMTREEEIDIKNQLLELDEAEYSNVKRTIKENDVHGLWSNADKAKLINTTIRGFGKNNIMLSRIGQLKFERIIDKLTPEQQQFYEPIEKALSNYVIGARKNIEERKFFGAENKEVSKLRTSIKRKRETLREVKTRTPAQAKWKELNRLKYELAPIEIKIETISGELKNNLNEIKTITDEEKKEKVQGYINNQKENLTILNERADRLKSQIKWVEENNNLKVKNVVVKRLKDEILGLNKQIEEIIGDIDHVEDSIGRLIADLAEKGVIHVKDERVVRDLLVSRFNTIRLEKVATTLRDASTIVTLNDITNAVTQITDLTFSAFKFGLFNTFQGMRGVEGLTRESLGINNIAEEFRGASGLSNWLNKQLKFIGLDLIDGFAKNTAINASVLTARQKAKKNDESFNDKLKFLFGEKEAQKVKQDLINGKMTDEIVFIAFNDLADIQPISTDQMARGYLSGFKPLYVLKTYSIKALDILRNECFSKISSGVKNLKSDKAKGTKEIAEGMKNLIRLQIFMWMFGLPQDLIKDLIANREFDIPDHIIDNILIFGIFNRFLINKVADNPANIYLENVKLPAIQAIGDLVTGIKQVQKGKKEVKDLYVWSRVPIVGKLYYNWLGGKKDKRVKLN